MCSVLVRAGWKTAQASLWLRAAMSSGATETAKPRLLAEGDTFDGLTVMRYIDQGAVAPRRRAQRACLVFFEVVVRVPAGSFASLFEVVDRHGASAAGRARARGCAVGSRAGGWVFVCCRAPPRRKVR